MATEHSEPKLDVEKDADKSSEFSSGDSVSFTEDRALERRVWRKLDTYMLPVVTMFWLLSFLDRTNLGNARLANLQGDLHMTNRQYSIALTVTYVPYIAAELPSNLLLKTVGPNLVLPTMLTMWGLVTLFQGFVTNYQGLLVCRFFLGLFEGGVFPGLVLYLSYFYPRRKMNTRIAVFFSAASISGAFGGLLAYGILNIKNTSKHPWAWIFIIEGLFTVLFGVASFWLLPRSPTTAYFLKQDEKEYIVSKLKEDQSISRDESRDQFNWKEVGRAFLLPQVLFLGLIFFLSGVVLFSLAYFSPTIIATLGYKGTKAQLMSVPPYAAAFVVTMLTAYVSDKYNCRGYVSIFCSFLCIIGFGMFLGSTSKHVQYGSLFFSISGVYASGPALASWSSNNAAPQVRRATAIAIAYICTNSGGILSTWLLGYISTGPKYRGGIITLLTMSCVMLAAAVCNLLYLKNQNKKKALIRANTTRDEEDPSLGDKSAWFIYTL
ncbi:major facilitator superfamily domain-containing protein [Mycena floridula]|nr:major facilitator superfamily domain-containing protein [Mycena floridula]